MGLAAMLDGAAAELPAPVRRAKLLDGLRHLSTPRTRQCRRVRIASHVEVQRIPDGTVRTVGLCTCGSVHGCPMCASKIYTVRSKEVTSATEQWRDSGGYVYMVTCTLAHEWNDDLKLLRTGLGKAWSSLWAGREGKARSARLQKAFHVRAVEVTHGQNGYHPHVHALLFLDRELQDSDKQNLSDAFKDAVTRVLGSRYAPNDEHGCRIDDSHRTDYIAKLGLEIAAITSKGAKNGNRTMWQVANDAASGDVESSTIWSRYVRAMFGARQLCWSKGARKYFGIQHLTDKQIASDEVPIGEPLGVAHLLAKWSGFMWDIQCRRHKYWTTKVIQSALHGAAALVKLPGQDSVPLQPGHLAISREELHPIAWRRCASKNEFELTEQMIVASEKISSDNRNAWRDFCISNGLNFTMPDPSVYREARYALNIPGTVSADLELADWGALYTSDRESIDETGALPQGRPGVSEQEPHNLNTGSGQPYDQYSTSKNAG